MASKLGTLFRRLFSGGGGGGDGGGGAAAAPPGASVAYRGYTIEPAPERSGGGQYRVAGVVRKAFPDGETKEHRFVRADTCAGRDEAESFTVEKAKRIIDEQGDRIFQPPPRR